MVAGLGDAVGVRASEGGAFGFEALDDTGEAELLVLVEAAPPRLELFGVFDVPGH